MPYDCPLVSIIIPCYNAELWIGEALDSCMAQTYRPLEIIVIDDGSTDGSLKVIQWYTEEHPNLIQYETGPNRGGCAARNRGFAVSKGEYALFLDADDLLEPETIDGQIRVMSGRTDVIVTCPWWNIEWTGNEWKKVYPHPTRTTDPLIAELRYGDFLPSPTLLWPRNVIKGLGGWDETLWANQDGDLRLRARLNDYQIIPSKQGGFAYRRYSFTTVSMRATERNLESRIRVLEKVEAILQRTGRLNQYRLDLSFAYHRLASGLMPQNELLGERALSHAKRLGGIRSVQGTLKHRLLCYSIGLKRKERLARWLTSGRFRNILGRNRVAPTFTEPLS